MKPLSRFLAVLCLVPLALAAQGDNPVLDDPREPHATLDFRPSRAAGALLVLRPLRIGSRNVANQSPDRRTWWVRPGRHTLQVAVSGIGAGGPRHPRRGVEDPGKPMTLTLKAGRRYSVAGERQADGTWTPVVWRVTDEASGEVLRDLATETSRR